VVKRFEILATVKNHFSSTTFHAELYNPAPIVQTVAFTFFVPDSVLITNLTMTLEGDNYVAELKSSKQARDEFNAAFKNKESAILLQVSLNCVDNSRGEGERGRKREREGEKGRDKERQEERGKESEREGDTGRDRERQEERE
jgi:hypothetical protein